MSDYRDSDEQLKDELYEMYEAMTDPEKIKENEIKKEIEEKLEEIEEDYGI